MKFDALFVNAVEDRSLAPGTITRIRRCCSAVFSAAVKKEIIRRNPVSKTEFIRHDRRVESFLDENQATTLLDALEKQADLQFKTMITTLLFTGMRAGELCGLQWPDVDLENGILFIRHTLIYLAGNKALGKESYVLQTPKTQSSERYVKIPTSLVKLLTKHKAQQDERRLASDTNWIDRGVVFSKTNGDYYGIQYLNLKLKVLAKKIGLPNDIHTHSLRHTTASLLINNGVSAKAVADQLGHASTGITNDLYAHIFASSKVKNMQVLELARARPNGEAAHDEDGFNVAHSAVKES
jgi:integrase